MKRSKETYKLGRKLMNTLRVPMTRLMTDNKTGKNVRHISHYHKNELLKRPKKLPNGDYTTKKINIKAGQVRTRRPKTASEAAKYYGSAIDSAVAHVESSLVHHYFSDSIATSASVKAPDPASQSLNSDDSHYQPKHSESVYKKFIRKGMFSGTYMTKESPVRNFKNSADAKKYVDKLLSKQSRH